MKYLIVLAACLLLFESCQEDTLSPKPDNSLQLIHIAHTRTDDNGTFVSDLNRVDFRHFDLRMLGGDLALDSSGEQPVMDSLDRIFDLDNENTLWALGNHDYSNLELVEAYTARPKYYTHHFRGITFLVLDTQDNYSNFTGDQLDLMNTVLDTIAESKYLFLIHHKLVWLYGEDDLQEMADDISNANIGDCFYCLNPNNFYDEVYPHLVKIKERGIEVYCIGGDLGVQEKVFYHLTDEGIYFLASGINKEDTDNRVILFDYDAETGTLSFDFLLLSQLE